MAAIDREQPVEVNIGDCRCSGDPRPHPDGDVVFLRPKPDLTMGLASASALRQSGDFMGDTEAALYSVFVRYGVVAWNVRDEKGPVVVTPEAVLDRLGWAEGGAIVAARAAALYRETILGPLVRTSPEPQQPTHKNGSTSRSPRSGRRSPSSSPRPSPSGRAAGR